MLLNVAFTASVVVGDIIKGRLGLDSIINLVFTAAILYLVMNYPLAETIVGWLLLFGTILTGLTMLKLKKQ